MKWLLEILGLSAFPSGDEYEQALERVIDGIDPRLRLVPGYQRRLLPALQTALAHIDEMVERIPGPLELSREAFISNPEVKAFFATPDEMENILYCSGDISCFNHQRDNISTGHAWALLCANKEEKTLLGMELAGNEIRREVKQTAINFYDHKLMAPAATEEEVRCGIKKCIFDGLITFSLQHIITLKSERQELEDQRRILHARLRARQSSGNGLSSLMASVGGANKKAEEILTDLQITEAKLQQLPASEKVLGAYLEEIKEILSHPQTFIQMNVACFRLDHMGIMVDNDSTHPTNTVCFSELEIAQVLKRVVSIVHFPCALMQ